MTPNDDIAPEWIEFARRCARLDRLTQGALQMTLLAGEAAPVNEARLAEIQRGLSRLNPMQRSSPETVSCVFCGADKTHSYVTGDRTPHADNCEWRLACEARKIPWDHVL